MQHAERMNIAEEFLSFLKRKFSIRAAAVVGSTAKGKDMERSDLEVAVIVGGKKPSDVHFIHKGISVSTEFHTDEEVRQALTVPRWDFVLIANEYQLAQVLYDPEKLYEDYKLLIAKASDQFWQEVARHALVVAYEQLCKVRNMGMLADEGKLRMPCIWYAEVLATYVAAMNRSIYTTSWDIYDSHNTFSDLPDKYAEAFPRLCGLLPVDAKELVPLAEDLWVSVEKHAKSRDITMIVHDALEDSIAGG